ncbi:MAG: alpha-1,4-glucan--maltose-1-phosphate maltosyltransferase [Acidobacteria bacterium]|nr:alpha-1,4-glucan--maltose-1-phosphate maltosyltransferase [Acidobacteriota bacterium]
MLSDVQDAPRVAAIPATLSRRVIVEDVRPRVDDGRFPIKRTAGERVRVVASLFADGHAQLAGVVQYGPDGSGGAGRAEVPLSPSSPGTDQWSAEFTVGAPGWWEYRIVAWIDPFRSWLHDLAAKARAGVAAGLEPLEGAMIIRAAAARAGEIGEGADDANALLASADAVSGAGDAGAALAAAMGDRLARLMFAHADRTRATTSRSYRVWVDRERARFGAWYEMFPRSAGPDPSRSGTFDDARALLPRIADLGFDVLYLPPIHPIGVSHRKGPNNTLATRPGDPGSPWAIGGEAGGHTAIDPGLGTLDDFRRFRKAAGRLGLEIALDLAFQCSPDHPWVREHPDWFRHRPDGSIRYAENPPKRYQDIYPLDFESDDWPALWEALRRVTVFWIEQGVRIFRVDNPHTKTLGFWEWLIARIQGAFPDVVFLAEAFTRPAVMHHLAKAGFTQSYTYFTWRNTKDELTGYFTELAASGAREYLRPNLFANTPDILHAYLQTGGRAAFQARLLLAATLGASFGIYSGFELAEGRAVPGTEEYADSEKYQFRKWPWSRPGHIEELIAKVNAIRRRHRALQFDDTLRFHATDNPQLIAYSKRAPDGSDLLLMIVNLDPRQLQQGYVDASFVEADAFVARDLIDDARYWWRRGWNYVRLDPEVAQGHILQIRP